MVFGGSSWADGLAGDFESEILDHLVVFRGSLSLGGQVVPDEEAIGDIQAEWLQGSKVSFATACDSKFAGGVYESHHGQSADAISRGQVLFVLHRGAVDSMKEVQWD